jgi:hypothetical protein
VVSHVKALACELPAERGLPLSRFSCAEIRSEVLARGIAAEISETTIWRWLHQDALRPWNHRSWIFPRDREFETKASRVLDLYHRIWEGADPGPREFVLSADEKTQLQIRSRIHPTVAPAPGRAMRVEHEYRRLGTCAYLAAWDVHHGRLFGRVADRGTIPVFDALVGDVMEREPYASADRVFWVVDNGTLHRGQRARDRLQAQWPSIELVHLPIHASWLNQIEIHFSILQRKALTPDNFESREEIERRILGFQSHYEQIAKPFEWKFTRQDLRRLLNKCSRPHMIRAAA